MTCCDLLGFADGPIAAPAEQIFGRCWKRISDFKRLRQIVSMDWFKGKFTG